MQVHSWRKAKQIKQEACLEEVTPTLRTKRQSGVGQAKRSTGENSAARTICAKAKCGRLVLCAKAKVYVGGRELGWAEKEQER